MGKNLAKKGEGATRGGRADHHPIRLSDGK